MGITDVHFIVGIYVRFSQDKYIVDESAGYVTLKVIVSKKTIPISVNVKIFVSSKFQPKAGEL